MLQYLRNWPQAYCLVVIGLKIDPADPGVGSTLESYALLIVNMQPDLSQFLFHYSSIGATHAYQYLLPRCH